MYKKSFKNGILVAIITDNGRTAIPLDPANTDYQAYLEWLEAGNEPEIIES